MPIALVTGSGGGLGAEIVRQLVEAGFEAEPCPRASLDVSSHKAVRGFLEAFGPVDVLVNNAAILGPVGKVEDIHLHQWTRTLQVNLTGAMLTTQAVLLSMKARRRGKIINIAGGGATGPLPRRAAYAVSKAALVRFTECIAAEVVDFGIDVNAVLPGPMPTDMMDDILAAGPERLGVEEFQAHSDQKDVRAIERAANLVCYLASAASDGLTGRTLSARFDRWPVDVASLPPDMFTLRRIDGR